MYAKICKMIDIWKGYLIACKLLRTYKGYNIISMYSGVGDRVFVLAYIKEFFKANNISKWKIVSATPDNAVYYYFDIPKDHIIFLHKPKMNCLNLFYTSDFGASFRHKHPDLLSISINAYVRKDFYDYSNLFYFSDVIKNILRLPISTEAASIKTYPMSLSLVELFDNDELQEGNTVVINPYANSCSSVPLSFFQGISDMLRKNGFTVVTSTVGAQLPLKDTKGIDFKLIEAIDFCSKCGFVIGQRSGFMDLIAFSSAKIICVDDVTYPHSELFRLERCWPQNNYIETIRFGSAEETKLIADVVMKVNEWKAYCYK